MKNLLFPIVVAFIMIPSALFAATGSGACSWHGGVSCSAGRDRDGSVICSDGWTDSTVSYSDVCETIYIPKCLYPQTYGCFSQSQLDQKRALLGRSGLLGTEMDDTAKCAAEIELYKAELEKYNQCLSAMYSVPLSTPKPPVPPVDYNASCVKTHGTGSEFSFIRDRCECSSGFAPDERTPFQCVTMRDYCKSFLGTYSYAITQTYMDDSKLSEQCACMTSYEYSSETKSCEIIRPKAPPVYIPSVIEVPTVTELPKPVAPIVEPKPKPSPIKPKVTPPKVEQKPVVEVPKIEIVEPVVEPKKQEAVRAETSIMQAVKDFFSRVRSWWR